MSRETRLRECPSRETERGGRRIQCPHYSPLSATDKHCRHYIDGGSCRRPGELQCVEWLRANGHPTPPIDPLSVDLFGHPTPDPRPAHKPTRAPTVPSAGQPRQPSPETGKSAHEATRQTTQLVFSKTALPPLGGFTTEAIESFKQLKAAVCFDTDFGKFWLVPEPIDSTRREITPEHLATICHAMLAFPGARVVSFESLPTKKTKKENSHE